MQGKVGTAWRTCRQSCWCWHTVWTSPSLAGAQSWALPRQELYWIRNICPLKDFSVSTSSLMGWDRQWFQSHQDCHLWDLFYSIFAKNQPILICAPLYLVITNNNPYMLLFSLFWNHFTDIGKFQLLHFLNTVDFLHNMDFQLLNL